MLLAPALVSCSDSGTPDPEPGIPAQASVVLRITVSNSAGAGGSRVTPEGDYDRGEGYENYIDIDGGNFRFYFFGTDNRLIAPLDVDAVVPVESTSSSKTYTVYSMQMDEAINGQVKIVALANWPSYPAAAELRPGVTTIDDIVGRTYEFTPASMELSAKNLVPLYGVTNAMTLDYSAGNTANIGTIHMLRAFAKVEVAVNDKCVYPLEYVKLQRYNTRGYCAPRGVRRQDDYVHNSYDQDYTAEPSIPEGCESAETFSFMEVTPGRWLAYIPEYRNVGRPDDQRCRMLVKFKGNGIDAGEDLSEDILYFAVYNLNTSPIVPQTHFDVLRNVWYKFTVNKNAAPIVQVVPYNEVDLEPVFGLMVGTNYVPILEENGTIRYWYDPYTGTYYGPDKVTPITDPYVIILQPEGWLIIRDLLDKVIGYYDVAKNQYYDIEKKPVDYINIDAATGWQIVRNVRNETVGYYDTQAKLYYDTAKEISGGDGKQLIDSRYPDYTVRIDSFGHVLWYRDEANKVWYNAKGVRVKRNKDAATGWYNLYATYGNTVEAYYDADSGKYYKTDKTTETSWKALYVSTN